LLLHISESELAPILFSFIQRESDQGFGESRSSSRSRLNQMRRGVIAGKA
jgi:4-hydroxyphenylpyruvate dioxygenase-like putative hemolysin